MFLRGGTGKCLVTNKHNMHIVENHWDTLRREMCCNPTYSLPLHCALPPPF